MKQYLFLALAALVFTSCSEDNDSIETIDESQDFETVTFQFSPYTMTSEPFSTRATTRAAGDPITITDVCTHLDIFIKDDADNITTINQTSSTTGYGSASIVLNKTKTYTIYAVGHSCSGAATLSEGVISFPDVNLSETFYYTDTFTPTASVKTCAMDRKVARFSLWITDVIPEEVTKITIQASSSGRKLNVDGTAADLAARTREFTSWTSAASGTLFSMNILPTSMTEATTMTFTVTAYNSSDETVETKTFRDYKTMYKGTFFTSNELTFSFSGTDWYSYDTVNF